MTQTMISVQNVQKSFKKQQVLKGITFEVKSGEIIALLGENGAGKSTLINIINKIITPSEGNVTLFDDQYNEGQVKNRTGVMLQNNIIIDRLSVKEVIELSRSYYKDPLTFEAAMDIAQLDDQADLLMSKLSGGQQRRLSFALALVGNPDLIFLDEPTANMDSRARYRLWQTIAELKQAGKTIIITSHQLADLEDIATRIFILQDGVIAFDGSIDTLRKIQGEGTIAFRSQLSMDHFKTIQPLTNLFQQDHYYTLITQEVNQVVKQLVPFLDDIQDLSIQQTPLETLFRHFSREDENHEKH
ncbi:ABC transporter ATP-binding protein [Fundicoccus culcitae]|uniref:ABC transporter ATP-binding protein n=1 Tax=Fundicoccus culcitae TaxID=2969821 RepID=A0ABY5P557_9LACT|nr:ABC transporter ATP-binding protein [Fundicoccus culcitae]UUX33877.1 ABC transporter ATP-binding protein [Fundicoccus culcitae]